MSRMVLTGPARGVRLSPLLLAALLAACGHGPSDAPVDAPQVDRDSIRFAPDSPQLQVLRSVAAEAAGTRQVPLPARLTWDDTRTAYLRAPLAGQVAQLVAAPGQPVRAGQTLAWISSPEFGQLQAEGARGEAELRQARQELARVRELHEAGIASGRELDEAEAGFAASRAEQARTHSLAQALGNGGRVDQRLPLRTPLDGILVERNISPGMSVSAESEQPLAVVSDPDHLWLLLDVPEHLAGQVRAGQEVRIEDAGGQPRQVPLQHVADYVDRETRVVQARAVLDNSGRRFKAGQYLRATLALPLPQGVAVPVSAVLLIDNRALVFVDEGEGRYRRQPVRSEDIGDGRAWVHDGLRAGQRVVVDGGLLLQQLLDQPRSGNDGSTQAAP
ncbi:efflux RND transporter periplasmic adaptor subunit [Stenotrophomonas mori]|uniref:Efflux RND transporter periplasmic adaptor subunit n=1 Tax=Stenotrophomonas mori TaxID=2871096 RepID=A0ABT0SH47_9GAMM|nr:efflux RND transporter periplasmic adaptor subunit [Stenotrophomonas mori]MCL7714654.1 efflux RND transporter periplasmic adaptor subunit [Stenotrophomonas mori]